MKSPTNFSKQVYKAVRKIPQGKVSTYAQIAKMIGNPKSFRAVGNALHKNPFHPKVPCHRVVNRDGMLAKNFGMRGKKGEQRRLLLLEGVRFQSSCRVDLKKCLW